MRKKKANAKSAMPDLLNQALSDARRRQGMGADARGEAGGREDGQREVVLPPPSPPPHRRARKGFGRLQVNCGPFPHTIFFGRPGGNRREPCAGGVEARGFRAERANLQHATQCSARGIAAGAMGPRRLFGSRDLLRASIHFG